MNLSGFLGDILNSIYSTGWLSCLLIGWIFTPIMMFIIGIVSEHRILPFWRGQSRAFIPGDFLLGTALAAAVYQIPSLPADGWWIEEWYPIAVAIFAFLGFLTMRLVIDAPGYDKVPGASKNCPTKWFHDIAGYFVYGTIVVTVVVPTIFNTPFSWANVIEIISLAIWGLGLVADTVNSRQMNPAKMHPSYWASWADGSAVKIVAPLIADAIIMVVLVGLAILV